MGLDEYSASAPDTVSKSQSNGKNHGKVQKRMQKAEREKMKREHSNDLFLSLANVLEVSEETKGKASVLSEATRLVKDMLAQIESLRSENAALLSESQYIYGKPPLLRQVRIEKEELEDENSSLAAQIAELQTQLKESIEESELDLNAALFECQLHESTPHYVDNCFRCPALDNAKPVSVVPISSDPSIFQQPVNAELASRPVTMASKP